MKTIYEIALEKHAEWKGKLTVELKAPLETKEDLSIAYTPGVAQPCLEIAKNKDDAFKYTWKGNIVAVVSDGTAVLGLGDIGPEAALPVMEGKAVLFKRFGGVNAIPIVLDTKDPDEIINIVKMIAPTFGGINLEDISAPRCVQIERKLIEELDIPVFHDDQHGTAIVVTAGLINALKIVKKKPQDITAVVSGAGAAGSSIIKMLKAFGVANIYAFNSKGVIHRDDMDKYNFVVKEIAMMTNNDNKKLTLAEAMAESDLFIGVSAPKVITKEMVASMKKDAIVFAMANPEPEIGYHDAKEAGARVVGTGRSDFPNQVNNVLAFPGLFRGALDVRSRKITDEMKMAAAEGIAALIAESDITEEYVIPSPFDPRVAEAVAKAVSEKAIEQGLARI
ncbi:NAD(P)-dependent malic enzyme [Youngiibacter multivorans]|uniref:Malate dehydrogenase (Oxaloacetate-decarboxylating) n=1 Tax=Youngiibacter multivorans TaxID=937251 RepID=A0ABS4G373_9CLOT|nr:malic enzyme-like NAD(P)-binding protein [Youngiibacter multivorans]MBP1918994.1 malate dehydrogenase (oxaloacetate-decarboxylating) [Youngiibacter multivorans]